MPKTDPVEKDESMSAIATTALSAGATKAAEQAVDGVVKQVLEPFISWLRTRLQARADRESFLKALESDFRFYTYVKPLNTSEQPVYVENLFAPIEIKVNGKNVPCLDECLATAESFTF